MYSAFLKEKAAVTDANWSAGEGAEEVARVFLEGCIKVVERAKSWKKMRQSADDKVIMGFGSHPS
ncbi:MAG TPA: hypothetical protein VIS99_12110 [Terrimicrobiaceae bacterium]